MNGVSHTLQSGLCRQALHTRRKCDMEPMYDKLGRRRSPATLPGFRKGIPNGNRGKRLRGETYTDEEVLLLITSQNRCSASGLRHRALIALLWRSGLRINEALSLEVPDLDALAATIHVRRGKGDKERRVAMDMVGWNYIHPWLQRRGELDGVHPERGFVFCVTDGPTRGGRLGDAHVRTMLKRAGEMSDIKKRIHPHGLRHSHAVGCFEEGMDLRVIQAQLGHGSLAITSHYLDHLSPKAQQDAITSRPDPFADRTPAPVGSALADAVAAVAAAMNGGIE